MDRHADPASSVIEAKQRLRSAAAHIDYLAPVKRHPLPAAGAAFAAGLLWNRLGRNRLPPGLLSLALQLLRHF